MVGGGRSLFPLLSVHLSLCLSLVVGFFFLAAIWANLILVSNCSGCGLIVVVVVVIFWVVMDFFFF